MLKKSKQKKKKKKKIKKILKKCFSGPRFGDVSCCRSWRYRESGENAQTSRKKEKKSLGFLYKILFVFFFCLLGREH